MAQWCLVDGGVTADYAERGPCKRCGGEDALIRHTSYWASFGHYAKWICEDCCRDIGIERICDWNGDDLDDQTSDSDD